MSDLLHLYDIDNDQFYLQWQWCKVLYESDYEFKPEISDV